jgi:hypothetical protein
VAEEKSRHAKAAYIFAARRSMLEIFIGQIHLGSF